MRVLVVIGTRPEAIKLAPLVRALRADGAFAVTACVTSQHRELLAPVLSFFGVPCDVDLQVMTPGQTLTEVTARVLAGVGEVLAGGAFDLAVVQGDTATAFAAGLAAFYARVPLAHVEAGLRSGDLARPFPEEGYRRLLDVLSAYLFAPTPAAARNLRAEGHPPGRIFVTGNTGIDALLAAAGQVRADPRPSPFAPGPGEWLVLVTAHRRESFGEGLGRVCRALAALVERHPGLRVLLPVHPNPNVREAVQALHGLPRVALVEPLEYPDMVRALLAADLVLTDSGGLQEEAPALGKRVLVLRETTERPEGVEAGAAELVGTDVDRIVGRVSALLGGGVPPGPAVSPYGDGRACARVVEVLKTGALSSPFGPAPGAPDAPRR